MKITELISEGANVTISIGLKELQEWHREIMEDSRKQIVKQALENAEEQYLSPTEACKMLSVSRATLSRWQSKEYLVPIMVGGRCKYRKSEIQSILNSKNRI
jgi:transcriptional regulator with PAS, ATPase and Fis domain